jgi:ferritin-like metal-binding protein YciE
MKLKNLHDLFVHELRDIYNAEKQILKALPKMAKACSSNELRAAFEEHLEQTRHQVERLEQVFEDFDQKAKGRTCEAMEGLVEEGADLMDEVSADATLDAGLIAAAQKVEHYEIAAYGCLLSWARQLGHERSVDLLRQTLDEEKAADQKLTTLAEHKTNIEADERFATSDVPR